MKHIFRKNQFIIAALAIMIAAAGYLNYSGRIFGEDGETLETNGELTNQELLDISEEDLLSSASDIESQDSETDGTVEGTPGEAVLTSAGGDAIVADAKVTREQIRAKNKESLLEIINNENLNDAQKTDAVNQMVKLTEIAEKEAAAETLLASKGFSEAVVSLSDGMADVVVNASDLSDAQRAQIEDIVSRKAGVPAENIIITPIHSKNSD